MKILLACSAGMSTSLLERNINTYIQENKIDGLAVAMSSDEAKAKFTDFDVILLGPQVRFMFNQFKTIVDGKVPVEVINPADYAMAKGENVYKTALNILKK